MPAWSCHCFSARSVALLARSEFAEVTEMEAPVTDGQTRTSRPDTREAPEGCCPPLHGTPRQPYLRVAAGLVGAGATEVGAAERRHRPQPSTSETGLSCRRGEGPRGIWEAGESGLGGQGRGGEIPGKESTDSSLGEAYGRVRGGPRGSWRAEAPCIPWVPPPTGWTEGQLLFTSAQTLQTLAGFHSFCMAGDPSVIL